ncbi:MAG: DUF4426 domain-containing protein [Pseudomonadota bacterium]
MRTQTCTALLLSLLSLAACARDGAAPTASTATATQSSASATTTVGGVTLQTSTVAIKDLNATIAGRYGIDLGSEGVLLLVTVRDPSGNGIDPGDLQLQATAGTLTEAPKPLPMRAIVTDGMTDYIGAFQTGAPATVQFRLTATRGGSRADIASTAELYPR